MKFSLRILVRFFSTVAAFSLLIHFGGCAGPKGTSGLSPVPSSASALPPGVTPAAAVPGWTGGQYHTLARGETLWRLGQMYGISIDEIMAANKIKNPRDIPAGKRLWIPAVRIPMPNIPLYRSTGKWRYIVIHHTATMVGDAATIGKFHDRRGFKGLGYHFLIDNGSNGRGDGEIEIARRWYRQEKGAHARDGNMNEMGIGVALVGNFSVTRVSDPQMNSLVYLVKLLMDHYDIPPSRVIGHRDVPGARTACPGKYFPWREFNRRI